MFLIIYLPLLIRKNTVIFRKNRKIRANVATYESFFAYKWSLIADNLSSFEQKYLALLDWIKVGVNSYLLTCRLDKFAVALA